MSPLEINRNWPWLAQLLSPSIEVDDRGSLDQTHALLLTGDMELATVHVPNGAGLIVTHLGIFDGVPALWIPYIRSFWKGGPKAWLRTMRDLLTQYEDFARQAGCDEVRIGGRDYARVFEGYERYDDKPNRLRKRL